MISAHNCDYHKYADDTELSKSAPPNQFTAVLSCIRTCIDDVLLWMNSNKLKLNSDKIEVMPVGSASRLESVGSECANTKHLACVLSRAPTNRVSPAVTVPKRCCYSKNRLVYPGFSVEPSTVFGKRCVCVWLLNVDGCI